MANCFIFDGNITAYADAKMNNPSVKRFWKGFSLESGELNIINGEKNSFRFGDVALPVLPDEKEYAIHVDANGGAIVGKDYGGLLRGFMSLLMKIECDEDFLKIKAFDEVSNYVITNRMIHLCVFPDNDFNFIKKLIRLSALCQYTHIVIEFWGMLKFDCLNELSWPNAFSKDEVKTLINEAYELGIEPIPMSNQLGHATASRGCYGRHVVLDQNPRLQYLFTPDGWAWNIGSEKVSALLKNIRSELYELFGDGEYIHIGCDEAYIISRDPDLRKKLPEYMMNLTSEVESEGRRPMIWMDMFLEKDAFKDCYSAGEKDEVEMLRNSMAKSTVFVDWQYWAYDVPIPSLASLKDCGYDVIGAPWSSPQNYKAMIETVRDNSMFGIMYTTWHTLKADMKSILGCAKECGASTFVWGKFCREEMELATMLRRICSDYSNYEDFGWAKHEIDV